jgi:hypothetical protein
MSKLRVYLDNCAYNRPYDNQNDISIRLESEAKLFIQEKINDNQIDLVWLSMNSYENNDNPSPSKRLSAHSGSHLFAVRLFHYNRQKNPE